MKFCRELYVTDNIADKTERIKWKIRHNAGQINIYVITLAANTDNLFDIIPAQELMQKYYPKSELVVVGLARGREAAMELAGKMVMDVFHATHSFDVRSFFDHKTSREQHKGRRRQT